MIAQAKQGVHSTKLHFSVGLFDLVPAMCALDYAMSEAGGVSHFVRECTLANGDDYCDCGYKKRVEG